MFDNSDHASKSFASEVTAPAKGGSQDYGQRSHHRKHLGESSLLFDDPSMSRPHISSSLDIEMRPRTQVRADLSASRESSIFARTILSGLLCVRLRLAFFFFTSYLSSTQ